MCDILRDLNENNVIYTFEPLNYLCTEKNIVDNNLTDTIKLYKVGLVPKIVILIGGVMKRWDTLDLPRLI